MILLISHSQKRQNHGEKNGLCIGGGVKCDYTRESFIYLIIYGV